MKCFFADGVEVIQDVSLEESEVLADLQVWQRVAAIGPDVFIDPRDGDPEEGGDILDSEQFFLDFLHWVTPFRGGPVEGPLDLAFVEAVPVDRKELVTVGVGVVSPDFENLRDKAMPGPAFQLNDDVEGIPDIRLDGSVGQVNSAL